MLPLPRAGGGEGGVPLFSGGRGGGLGLGWVSSRYL